MTAPAVSLPRTLRVTRYRWGRVALGVLAVLVSYALGPEVFFSVAAAFGLAIFASSTTEFAIALTLLAVSRVALLAGLFHFQPSDQIIDLAIRDVNPFWFIVQNDIWWPRYLLSYPAVFAMDNWGFQLDRTFALYSVALLPVEAFVVARTAETLGRRGPGFQQTVLQLTAGALVLGLATQMNGRLIPAHLGMALMLAGQCGALVRARWTAVSWLLVLVGLVMAEMTSGAGIVAFAQLVVGSLLIAMLLPRERWSIASGVWIVSALWAPFIYREVDKNVTFFGGGLQSIVGMLQHGAGGFLVDHPFLIAGILGALTFVMVASVTRGQDLAAGLSRAPALYPILLAIPISLAGGLFGYSTLTMVFPAIFVLVAAISGLLVTKFKRRGPTTTRPG